MIKFKNFLLAFSLVFFTNIALCQKKKEYYKNGKLKAEMKFNKKGELKGVYKAYYEDGSIKLEGRYKKNLKRGSWKEYDINGILKKESFYDKSGNLKIYNIHTYNSKGQLKNIKSYGAKNNYLGYSKYTYTPLGQNNRIMTYDTKNKLIYEKIVSYYSIQNATHIKESECEYLYKTEYQERKVTCSYYNSRGQLTSKQVNGKAIYTK